MVMHTFRPSIVDLMRKIRLLPHITQCLVSGFDEIESVLEMDTSEEPTNSIDVIERYINGRKMHYPQCMDPNQPRDITFEMSRGHRIRVNKFILDIKQRHGSKRKIGTGSGCRSLKRKPKRDCDLDEPNEIGIFSVEEEIRKKAKSNGVKQTAKRSSKKTKTLQYKSGVMFYIQANCKCGGINKIRRKEIGGKPQLD